MAWRDWIQGDFWRAQIDAHGGKALFVAAVASLFLLFFEYPPTPERARLQIENEYARARSAVDRKEWTLALVRLRTFVRNHSVEEAPQIPDAHYRIALALEGQVAESGTPWSADMVQNVLSELRSAAESRAMRPLVDPRRLACALRLQDLGEFSAALHELHLLDQSGATIPGLNEIIARSLARLPHPSTEERLEVRRRLEASRRALSRAPAGAPLETIRLWLEEAAFEWHVGDRAKSAAASATALALCDGIKPETLDKSSLAVFEDARAEALYGIGRCELAEGRMDEAKGRFGMILKSPETAWSNHARFGTADIELRQGHPREALVGFYALSNPPSAHRTAVALDEVRIAAAFRCGDTFADLGDYSSALESYQKALTFVPPFPRPDLFDRKAWEKRLGQIRVLASDGRVLDRLEQVGILLQGVAPESIVGFDLAGGAAEREVELAEEAAQAARADGDAAGVAEAMARGDAAALRAGKHYAMGTGSHISSIAHVRNLYWRAGKAYVRGGHWSGAIAMLEAFVNIPNRGDPNRNEALYLLGRAYQETGDPDRARQYFERTLSDPEMAHQVFSNYARLAQAEGDLSRGQYESAINELKAVFTAGHLGPEALEYRRALFLLGEAEYEDALVFAAQQGKTPLALSRLLEAKRHLQEGLRRAPTDLPHRLRAQFFLGAIAREMNRMDDTLLPGQRRRNLEIARDAWRDVLDIAGEIERLPLRPAPPRGREEREVASDALAALTQKAGFLLADAHYELALSRTGRPDDPLARQEWMTALQVYSSVQAKYHSSAPRTDLLWALIRMGRISARLGKPNDAAAHLEQAQFTLDQLVRAPQPLGRGASFDPREWQTMIDEAQQSLGGVPR